VLQHLYHRAPASHAAFPRIRRSPGVSARSPTQESGPGAAKGMFLHGVRSRDAQGSPRGRHVLLATASRTSTPATRQGAHHTEPRSMGKEPVRKGSYSPATHPVCRATPPCPSEPSQRLHPPVEHRLPPAEGAASPSDLRLSLGWRSPCRASQQTPLPVHAVMFTAVELGPTACTYSHCFCLFGLFHSKYNNLSTLQYKPAHLGML